MRRISPCWRLILLIASDVLDATKSKGRPIVLSTEEKDQLVAIVKRDFKTRRMRLVDIEGRQASAMSAIVLSTRHCLKMKRVLKEWERITIEEINAEIAKLPEIMQRCIKQNGGNKFHA